jgi:hypothetical protein
MKFPSLCADSLFSIGRGPDSVEIPRTGATGMSVRTAEDEESTVPKPNTARPATSNESFSNRDRIVSN